ncbi:DUF1403 family protein [Allomesorhizobium camelthorni]|uniref:DUF1403 family protein n=1 Tax=Allomesorhizobium camelthorni TaxID=475069 RepID=A0A6G4WMW1_9HYPH|nr:DUF1403 family protein [Mesorhizobium camelthorni]NGO55536.1 DUF1403 family protein [Mesorhizobium camelthorni]
MIRADPSPLVAPLPPRVPGWALPDGPVSSDADAAFCAGAALTSLDNLVRSEPLWAGAWRQRLALKCAASAVRLAGRSEDEAALRDAWYLRPPDTDPGPAGTVLGAWRQLALRPPVVKAARLAEVVELLGLRWDDGFADLPDVIDDLTRSSRPAPFAAAAIAGHVVAMRSEAETLGWWCADLVLAQKLRWARPVPLLMAQIFGPTFRGEVGHGKRARPGGEGFERAVCLALAQGAAEASRLGGEIARRADRLVAVAPKLRAKGAGEAITKLLDDDAVSGSLVTKNLSRFGSRRLFDRLMEFEAVRELSGRPTFRLYGL